MCGLVGLGGFVVVGLRVVDDDSKNIKNNSVIPSYCKYKVQKKLIYTFIINEEIMNCEAM